MELRFSRSLLLGSHVQGLWSIHNGTPDSQILFAKKICTTENMCHFAGPSLTPYPLTLVEKKGIFNIWTFSHGTPHPEASWIKARESCEKFKVLTNPHGTPLLKITLARISCARFVVNSQWNSGFTDPVCKEDLHNREHVSLCRSQSNSVSSCTGGEPGNIQH